MSYKLGILMDPIAAIKPHKDTSLALLLAAQKRDYELIYMEQRDLFLQDGFVYAKQTPLTVHDDDQKWFDLGEPFVDTVDKLDILLMRKDPPFDLEYVYTTHLLDLIEKQGVLVVNSPQALRDTNEKLFTAWFPQCCPPTLVSREPMRLKQFVEQQQDCILKPLDGMGGRSVFHCQQNDPNLNVILETLTAEGQKNIMAQRYLSAISEGDKRIILVDGQPVPYALARLPQPGDHRANLAAGGQGVGIEISAHDRWICEQVGPTLRDKGLILVGLDVIGDHLTEINVTSPTCIREIEAAFDMDICSQVLDCITQYLAC